MKTWFITGTSGGFGREWTQGARMVRSLWVQSLESRASISGLPNGVETREVEVASGLAVHLYTPPLATEPLPYWCHLHGGGWVSGSVATHDPFCRLLSEAADTRSSS